MAPHEILVQFSWICVRCITCVPNLGYQTGSVPVQTNKGAITKYFAVREIAISTFVRELEISRKNVQRDRILFGKIKHLRRNFYICGERLAPYRLQREDSESLQN